MKQLYKFSITFLNANSKATLICILNRSKFYIFACSNLYIHFHHSQEKLISTQRKIPFHLTKVCARRSNILPENVICICFAVLSLLFAILYRIIFKYFSECFKHYNNVYFAATKTWEISWVFKVLPFFR